jgi:putative membrane-bound dehydrogenase-like protein
MPRHAFGIIGRFLNDFQKTSLLLTTLVLSTMFFFKNDLSIILLLTALSLWSCRENSKQGSAIEFSALPEDAQRLPENALAAMKTAEGIQVDLFAAEPLLTNPTNMAVDARGRIWVCEANNYRLPYNPTFEERPAGDRILILEDTDGDGRADGSKVFYQGPEINAALGITVLGNRVIVSHSPNIFVFTDEDGDDKPDLRDTLFTGIDGPDDDHGAHAVIFGPDGRYYFNFGNVGHQLRDKEGRQVVDELGRPVTNAGKPFREGMAFRFDPDSSYVEVLGYNFRNIYELAVDPFGTVWQTDNDDDGNRGCRVNFVMEYGNYGYKDEITGAGWQERRTGMHEEIPLRHWHQNDPGVIPNLLQTGAGSPAGIVFAPSM